MARCERGYLCVVCGREVETLLESALYLRFVLGDVAGEELHRLPECHLTCDAGLAQYILDPAFPPVVCDGPFDKRTLDADFVRAEEARVTRGWRRLRDLPGSGATLVDYPIDSGSY